MTSRTRLWVLLISTPVIAFAIIGGYLGQAMAKDDTYQHLRVFEDVVSLVAEQLRRGSRREEGDAGRDERARRQPRPRQRVPAGQASPLRTKPTAPAGPADVGVELSRQYYLRVVSVRDGSPAAKAGLRTGDFIRAIDNQSTNDMSTYEGERLLHGPAGSKVTLLVIRGNAADPHEVDLTRERTAGIRADVADGRPDDRLRAHRRVLEERARAGQAGGRRAGQDRREPLHHRPARHARGDLDDGLAAARLFVKTGTLAIRETKGNKETVAAQPATARSPRPWCCSSIRARARAAEVFAAALDGNKRAELIGEHTLGRAARQKLVKLPDGSGLLLSYLRYLTPDGTRFTRRASARRGGRAARRRVRLSRRRQPTSRCSARSNTSRRRKPLDV